MSKKLISGLYNKKGQDMNLLFVVVMILVIAITIVAGFKAVKQLNTAVQNMDIATQDAKDMMQNVQDKYVSWFDIFFLLIFVFIFIIMIASAFFIDTHPVFFIISILLMVISAFVGGHIANAYASFAENNQLSAEANAFTVIPYIFQHYVALIVIMGSVTTIVLYAKIRSSGA